MSAAQQRLWGGRFAEAPDAATLRFMAGRDVTPSPPADAHLVADEDADVELAHLSRRVGQDILSGLQADLEHRVRQRLDDGRVHLDGLFLDLDLGSAVSNVPSTDGAAPAGTPGTGWASCQTGSP